MRHLETPSAYLRKRDNDVGADVEASDVRVAIVQAACVLRSSRYAMSSPEPPPSVRRVQLWSHPVIAGIVIVVLGVFWTLRKVVGLI